MQSNMLSNTNTRFVKSPSHSNSPNYSTINSILIAKTSSTNELPSKKLANEDMVQSQFLNESMMQNTRLDQQPALTIKGNYNVKESLVAMDRL
jgi:hypothetical protein